jgi:hypothetical protein
MSVTKHIRYFIYAESLFPRSVVGISSATAIGPEAEHTDPGDCAEVGLFNSPGPSRRIKAVAYKYFLGLFEQAEVLMLVKPNSSSVSGVDLLFCGASRQGFWNYRKTNLQRLGF